MPRLPCQPFRIVDLIRQPAAVGVELRGFGTPPLRMRRYCLVVALGWRPSRPGLRPEDGMIPTT